MKVVVIRIFRDKFTKEEYPVGKELEFEDNDRVEDLVSRGLVVVVEDKEKATGAISLFDKEFEKKVVVDALKAIGEKATWNMKDETIISNVAALNEEKTKSLKTALGI